MTYYEFTGTKMVNGVWEPITLEVGGSYSYGDFQEFKGKVTQALKKSLYVMPPLLEGSDHSGGSAPRSNHRVFLKQFEEVEGVYDVWGGFGFYSIAIRADVAEENEDIFIVLNGLENYSLIDEEDHSALENEWENAAMPDIVSDLGRHINLETYIPDYEKLLEDEENINQLVWDGINELSLDWSHETTSAYMDYERVQPYVEDRLLIEHCTEKTLPLLINRDWSCKQTKEMFMEKVR
jgi:hypothetical protein